NTVVTLEHNFLTNPTTGAFLKMSLNLLKKPEFTYEITSIIFSSASGSGSEIYSLTIPKETQEFFSIAVKPSNFSIMKAIEEVKEINRVKPAFSITSWYSSDVFDNSSLSGKTSNFSKVKMYLDQQLQNLFWSINMHEMGASLNTFNYPVYSYEYLNENDFSTGYGILRIASKNPNHFLPRIELKILFKIDKMGKDELVQVSLAKSKTQNKTFLEIESEKYQDLNKFISDLNKKSLIEKLNFFAIRSKYTDNPGTVIKESGIIFSPHFLEGIQQQKSLSIIIPLEPNYHVIENGKLATTANIVANIPNLFYPEKKQSDIKIKEQDLANKAKAFSNYDTFFESEKNNVLDYIETASRDQIIGANFSKNIIDEKIININIKINDSYIFDNYKQEKTFEVGNIAWNGQVPTLKEILLNINYDGIADFASKKNDPNDFITEFNKTWNSNLDQVVDLAQEFKAAIRQIQISATNQSRTFLINVSLKSGYYFQNQSPNNLNKTFSIINLRFNSEPSLDLKQLNLDINYQNLIYYIKNYKSLKQFIKENKDKFLIENDNNNSIVRMNNHYYPKAISKINVETDLSGKEIHIFFEIKSDYYYLSYYNPYFKLIITIDEIKAAYDNLNNNNNSSEVDYDLFYSLIQKDAKSYLNIDEFLIYLNSFQNINNYIKPLKGNIFAINNIILEKLSNNSFVVKIHLKEKHYFINSSSINDKVKEIRVSNISFKNEDLKLENVNIKLDIKSLVIEAKKYKSFDEFNANLTLETKIKFLVFVSGNKDSIKNIILEKLKDPHSINFKIILNDGYYFINEDKNIVTKEIVINNVYYDGEVPPNLATVDISIKGNELLDLIKTFPNFKSLAMYLNKKEQLMKFLVFSEGDEQAIDSVYIYKGKYWNDIYLQLNLANGYYFKGESINKTYQNILISNVRYSTSQNSELEEVKINFNFNFFFELFNGFDMNNFSNFSKENYKYLLNFTNNKSIIQLMPLNAKLVQSAIMYQDSSGFYFELRFVDGIYWDINNKSNAYYRKHLSFEEVKTEYKNYLKIMDKKAKEKEEALILIISLSSALLVSIIGGIIIFKLLKKRKAKRLDEN
ncbi:MAG: hypothetical protein ACRDBR_00435, partial [Metamycoplasmataceae bacterium]